MESELRPPSDPLHPSKPLNKYVYLLAPGLLGNLLGYMLYPPLDAGPLPAVLLLNGRLDASPPNALRVTVIQKTVTTPRTGTAYHLTVSSWRPGRSGEEFEVSSRTFNRAAVGETVKVELHNGFFGLPWSGGVSLE